MAVLREPTLRAYSNWADLREQGREKLDFASAMAAEEERRQLDWEPFWLYRELGLYGQPAHPALHRLPPRPGEGRSWPRTWPQDARRHRRPRCSISSGLEPLAAPLEDERLNQTMYTPVDRRSRMLETLFERGQRARPVVPRSVRRLAREVVRRRLRSQATAGSHGSRLRHEYVDVFAEDRAVLEGLGYDVALGAPGRRLSGLSRPVPRGRGGVEFVRCDDEKPSSCFVESPAGA